MSSASVSLAMRLSDTELPEGNKPETGKDDASIEGNGDGNGQVPPGQTEDGDSNIVNPGGHMPPGLNRGEKGEKPDNPNKPTKPDNPGTEDNTDKQANKANKGTHKYTYDELNRMTTSSIAGTTTTYTYDTLGNLVLEKAKNHVVDYQYNELNQLVQKKDGNESYTYTYDKRGNRTAEIGKKASRSYVYDETNRMVEGTNWKGDKSAYTYNGLGIRINNTHTTHAGKVYARDYVIDYTSFENDDLMVFAEGNGQLEYEQKHVYAGSERIEQFTDKGNWERTLYVHEDVMGNTRYYTKANGQSFAELTYDAWGMPESPNKLLNNDHGNYVFATFTGHIYDTTLDIYFAEARFYDANNRSWLAMDPVKDGLNWYQYCYSNPTTYFDPLGLWGTSTGSKQAQLSGSANLELQTQLIYLRDKHLHEQFGFWAYQTKLAINLYSSDKVYDFLVQYDDIITQSALEFNVPKEYVQAILHRELSYIDARDIVADSFVLQYCNGKLGIRKDSSTGLAQIFASTATDAINFGISQGIVSKADLDIPSNVSLDKSDAESNKYIWERLLSDPEFNIQAETLNIYASAAEVVGSTEFDTFSKEQIQNVLARYNGHLEKGDGSPNTNVITYGEQVYELYEAFKKYPLY